MSVEENTSKTIFIVGDSLAEEYLDCQAPYCGWGKFLEEHVRHGIKVINHARSGWTTETYRTVWHDKIYPGKSYWDLLIQDIKEGDWVIMCLGVNDASLVNEHRTSEEQYRENLTFFTKEIRQKGADIIFGTLHIRGGEEHSELGWNYDLAPKGIEPDMDQRWIRRTQVLCEIAKDIDVEVFPFGATLSETYEKMYQDYMTAHPDASVVEGRDYVRYFFHLYNKPINTPVEEGGLGMQFPNWDNDSTHLNCRGAKVYADIVAKLISQTNTELAKWMK